MSYTNHNFKFFEENKSQIHVENGGVNKVGYWGYLPLPLESWGHTHPGLVTWSPFSMSMITIKRKYVKKNLALRADNLTQST